MARGSGEEDVPVLAHVRDLSPQGDEGEDAEVHDEDGPEDGDVKDGNEGSDEGKSDCAGGAVPTSREKSEAFMEG